MHVKQVFGSYDKLNSESKKYKYCPYCGKKLVYSNYEKRLKCSACGFTHYKNPIPGIVVLITKGKNILLGKRGLKSFQTGKWCLPGGFIEYEEDFLTAAIRETKEETNLDVGIKSILSVVSNFLTSELHTVVIVLLAEVLGGNIEAGDDIDELNWFSVSEPLPEMAFLADKHIVERYFSNRFPGIPIDLDYSRQSFV